MRFLKNSQRFYNTSRKWQTNNYKNRPYLSHVQVFLGPWKVEELVFRRSNYYSVRAEEGRQGKNICRDLCRGESEILRVH